MRNEVTLVVVSGDREELVDGLVALAETDGVTVEQCRIGSDAIDPEAISAARVAERRAVPARSEAEPEGPEGSEDEGGAASEDTDPANDQGGDEVPGPAPVVVEDE